MRRYYPWLPLLAGLLCLTFVSRSVSAQETANPPFGGEKDMAFAEEVWTAMDGYETWLLKSDFYEGRPPHGNILRTYYSMIAVDGTPYHTIVKENYAGEDATLADVRENPDQYLASITVMVQRKPGYDEDHHNWFWVKYAPDGSVMQNDKNMALAGRVAKGMDTGCIACHGNAGGNDYMFTNDE